MVGRTTNTVDLAPRPGLNVCRVPRAGVRSVQVNARRNRVIDRYGQAVKFIGDEDVLVNSVGERLAYLNSACSVTEVELTTPVILSHMELEFEISSVRDRTGNLEVSVGKNAGEGAWIQRPVGEVNRRWRGL
jgi:hypothetical protein